MVETVFSCSESIAFSQNTEPPRKRQKNVHLSEIQLIKVDGIKSLPRTQASCSICKGRKTTPETKCRASIPVAVVDSVWRGMKIWIPPTNRMCKNHHNGFELTSDSRKLLGQDSTIRNYAELTREEIRDWVTRFASSSEGRRIDVDTQALTEEDYKLLFGVKKTTFIILFKSICKRLRGSNHRSPRNALAMFLCKLRLGLSQRMLGFLFGLPQRRVSKTLKRVSYLLEKEFAEKHLGFSHKTREQFIEENDAEFARRLHEVPENALIFVLDGTYIYVQQTGNHAGQRKLYSMQKGRPLLKVMVVVTTTGYIVDVDGKTKIG